MGTEGPLSFFLSEKNLILIATFVGKLTRESVATLEECMKQVAASKAKWVILHFRDVQPGAEKPVVPLIAALQKCVRDKPAMLRVSSLHPELLAYFDGQGLLRHDELSNNLAEALKSLPLDQKVVG